MPKSKIIVDVVEGTVSIEQSLYRLMVLAKDVKNSQLEEWARKEIEGYSKNDVLPRYRCGYSNQFLYSGINGTFKVTKAPLSDSFINKDHLDKLTTVKIYDGINCISLLGSNKQFPDRNVSYLANDVYENSKGEITCFAISQIIPQAIYLSIVSEIKTMMISALCELEKKYGNLDKMGIDISKRSSVDIDVNNSEINKIVFNLSSIETPAQKKEPLYSKALKNLIFPILAGIIASVVSTIIIQYFCF